MSQQFHELTYLTLYSIKKYHQSTVCDITDILFLISDFLTDSLTFKRTLKGISSESVEDFLFELYIENYIHSKTEGHSLSSKGLTYLSSFQKDISPLQLKRIDKIINSVKTEEISLSTLVFKKLATSPLEIELRR